jgi:hypothetical protein
MHDLKVLPSHEPYIYGVRYKGKYTPVVLTVTELKPFFEGFIKRFFDKYQIPPAKKKFKPC